MANASKATAKATPVVYNELSVKELNEALIEKTADLATATRSHRMGEVVNPRSLGSIRKDIARIKTALRANELKESK